MELFYSVQMVSDHYLKFKIRENCRKEVMAVKSIHVRTCACVVRPLIRADRHVLQLSLCRCRIQYNQQSITRQSQGFDRVVLHWKRGSCIIWTAKLASCMVEVSISKSAILQQGVKNRHQWIDCWPGEPCSFFNQKGCRSTFLLATKSRKNATAKSFFLLSSNSLCTFANRNLHIGEVQLIVNFDDSAP